MAIVIGIAVAALFYWMLYGSVRRWVNNVRVTTSKRYSTHQSQAPDLNQFARTPNPSDIGERDR